MIATLSIWAIPLIIVAILLYGTYKKVPTYEAFVDGGKEGLKIAVQLIPFLVGMLIAIQVFRASGAVDAIIQLIQPILSIFNIPAEIAPLALMRPISGTGALAITTDLIATHGPDSFIGRLASTMQGSTDTTLYILTVYFGAVGIKKMGDALKVGLLADLVGIVASIIIVSIVFPA